MNFDFIRFMIIVDCKYNNVDFHIDSNILLLLRTPSPPSIIDDPLRVRLFPSDSDDEINDNHIYL